MRKSIRLSCFCALSTLAAANAAAQQAAAPPTADQAAPAPASTGLEEIVVTARRTSESLQKAPVAITAIGGDTLTRSGIKNLGDLQSRMPSVELSPATSVPILFIRGVGTFSTQAGIDSAVAYTIDGIFVAHPQAYPPVLVDIARVELLRGPQGTLYGRNSNGGAINFLTNEPVLNQVQASAALTLGNYAQVGTEGVVNVPLGDSVAIRAAFGSDKHSSYYRNGYSNAENSTGRIRLLVQPASNLRIIASVDRYRIHNDGAGFDYCPPNSTSPQCIGRPFVPWSGLKARDPGDFNRIKTWGAYGQIDWTLPWATVTSLTSYRDNNFLARQTQVTPSTASGFVQGVISKFFTQEVRLASAPSSPIKWLVGGYYAHETGPGTEIFYQDGFNYFFSDPNLKSDSKAVFADVTVPISKTFRISGGIRYTDEDKSASGSLATVSTTKVTLPINDEFREKKVTWKAGAEFDVSDRSLLYGTVSTGFKSGGVNQVPAFPGFDGTYKPETVTAYQVGTKNRFFSNRVQLNAEAFYYDYRDLQALTVETDPAGKIPGFFLENSNSQKSTMYGGEIEATWAATPADRFTATVALLHAKFDRYLVGGQDLSGNHLMASPKYTIAGTYEHTFDLNNGAKLIFGIDSKLVAAHYMSNANEPGSLQNRYTRTNANLTYRTPNGHWEVIGFIKNMEKGAQQLAFVNTVDGDTVLLYPPRTFGATVRWHY
ncbi:TonB-dependent receptor [Sphingomonas sp. MMS24-J13]|uniref:TonB-dependent receptor n=1 Tax=Sphingomonas sp. MMS24-J13 TaxID=3238686 RepID=UPI00384CEBF4